MKLYKLTDRNGQTRNRTQWGEGVEHTASGEGDLCGPGWLHAYTHPLLAVLLNPGHADIREPILWEADGDVGKTDHGLEVGCTRLKTIKQIPLPKITTEQRVYFAILCAMEVCDDPAWRRWAQDWLSGKNRSAEAPEAAEIAEAEWSMEAARAAWTARAAGPRTWEAAEWAARAAAYTARMKRIDIENLAEIAKRESAP
jgi:hypothetical protein